MKSSHCLRQWDFYLSLLKSHKKTNSIGLGDYSFFLLQNYITFLSIIKNNINKYLHYKSEHKKIYKSGYFYILKIRVYFKP